MNYDKHRGLPVLSGAILLFLLQGYTGVGAQTLPTERSAAQLTPRNLAPTERNSSASSAPDLPPVLAPDGSDQLYFTPSGIFVRQGYAQLQAASRATVSRFEGSRISVAQLYALAAAIQSLYADAGYPLVQVGVPPQQLADGQTAELAVVDGYVERLALDGVGDALIEPLQNILRPLIGKRHLTAPELDRRIALIEDLPGASVRSSLVPGLEPGSVILQVDADHKPMGLNLTADNRSSEALGMRQMSANFSVNSALGLGEQLFVSYAGDLAHGLSLLDANPARRLVGAGAQFGLGNDGWRAGFELAQSTTIMAGNLETDSMFRRVQYNTSYPLVRENQQSLNFRLQYELQDEVRDIPLFDYRISADSWSLTRAILDGGMHVDKVALNGSVVYTVGRSRGDLALGGRFDATAQFAKLELAASAMAPLGNWVGTLQLRAQVVTDGTPPLSETMALEGRDGLPNQSNSSMSADQALSLRLGLSRPTALDWAPGWSVEPGVNLAHARAQAMAGFAGQATSAWSAGTSIDIRAPRTSFLHASQVSLQYAYLQRNGSETGGGRWLVDVFFAY